MAVKTKKTSRNLDAASLATEHELLVAILPESSPASRAEVADDEKLVKRCLSGDVSAWESLYAQHHDPLIITIRTLLKPTNGDLSLVDEIAARVWYALVANDGELLSRYDPKRGLRLSTFLRALAKDEMCRHFRTEKRRQDRERVSVQNKLPYHADNPAESEAQLTEFLDSLTEREKIFAQERLLSEEHPAYKKSETAYSQNTVWQLTYRILNKFTHFFGRDVS